jgi:hypothetical protein
VDALGVLLFWVQFRTEEIEPKRARESASRRFKQTFLLGQSTPKNQQKIGGRIDASVPRIGFRKGPISRHFRWALTQQKVPVN